VEQKESVLVLRRRFRVDDREYLLRLSVLDQRPLVEEAKGADLPANGSSHRFDPLSGIRGIFAKSDGGSREKS